MQAGIGRTSSSQQLRSEPVLDDPKNRDGAGQPWFTGLPSILSPNSPPFPPQRWRPRRGGKQVRAVGTEDLPSVENKVRKFDQDQQMWSDCLTPSPAIRHPSSARLFASARSPSPLICLCLLLLLLLFCFFLRSSSSSPAHLSNIDIPTSNIGLARIRSFSTLTGRVLDGRLPASLLPPSGLFTDCIVSSPPSAVPVPPPSSSTPLPPSVLLPPSRSHVINDFASFLVLSFTLVTTIAPPWVRHLSSFAHRSA
ncbi:hypothetical protein BO71DRAFT_429116 [Aspergillus ellipticus CBS 707.79]|uniref:Uncharacterized protein n=1 Tax=Aspergillus ellipticus CBS 707.79 TaxID=1448320 RepID=A0A319DDA4_9EURO|nr:hypothetical protein BO71DRAFT_429116 [Aspergillus ellipticus CBS 707.79]